MEPSKPADIAEAGNALIAAVTALAGRVAVLESDMEGLSGEVEALAANVETLTSTVDTLTNHMTTRADQAEHNLGSARNEHREQLAGIRRDIDDVRGDVAAVKRGWR